MANYIIETRIKYIQHVLTTGIINRTITIEEIDEYCDILSRLMRWQRELYSKQKFNACLKIIEQFKQYNWGFGNLSKKANEFNHELDKLRYATIIPRDLGLVDKCAITKIIKDK